MSNSYSIYKREVGGTTMNGDKMKDFDELPLHIKNAWIAIDTFYKKAIKEPEILRCKFCDGDIKRFLYCKNCSN